MDGGSRDSIDARRTPQRFDVFISHAGRDRGWAEWVAWQLREAGYSVALDAWDWAAGDNFLARMREALDSASQILALFSVAYFEPDRYTSDELSAALVKDERGMNRLVPVRIEDVEVPRLLRPLIAPLLSGLDEQQARHVLLDALRGPAAPGVSPFPGIDRSTPADPPTMKNHGGRSAPRLPGTLPPVWNLPARNPGFTGRDGLLVQLREHLIGGPDGPVQALYGIGGVGKTQLALEYAHRFSGEYDLAWWVVASEVGLVGTQLAAAAAEAGITEAGVETKLAAHAFLRHLRSVDRWLVIFDNAEDPDDLPQWIPSGPGHVLITSRSSRWAEVATPLEVGLFVQAESVALLRRRIGVLPQAQAEVLAAALADLPLALVQAAGTLAETGMSVPEYLDILESQAGTILDDGRPPSYPVSLAAAVRLAVDRLRAEDPAAAQLVRLCAILAPRPIDLSLVTDASRQLSEPLRTIAAERLAVRQAAARVARYGLARVGRDGVLVHRLVQAILRDQMSTVERQAVGHERDALLLTARPAQTDHPATWPAWARLLPHLLAVDPAATANPSIREMTCDAARYLILSGDAQSGFDLAKAMHTNWRSRLGEDHPHTLTAASRIGHALHYLGDYRAALHWHQQILGARHRLLGPDHPDTLRAANATAVSLRILGRPKAARELNEETLQLRKRVLGADHPETLLFATNLAADLRALDELAAALDLNLDTYDRYRRELGEEHPDTLRSANSVATDLRVIGRLREAKELDEQTLRLRKAVLGPDHPDTLQSATNLAADLRGLADPAGALELDRVAVAGYRKIFGEDHPETVRSAAALGEDQRMLH